MKHVSNSGQWWNMPKVCLASSHTTSTAQSAEQPSRHKELYTVAAVFYTQKNHHCYKHQTEDVGDSVRNYCMAFYGYHGSKCNKDKDAIQKYNSRNVFPLTGNGKYICNGNHFYAELSQMQKTYKNWVHLQYTLSGRKGKFLSHVFEVNLK